MDLTSSKQKGEVMTREIKSRETAWSVRSSRYECSNWNIFTDKASSRGGGERHHRDQDQPCVHLSFQENAMVEIR